MKTKPLSLLFAIPTLALALAGCGGPDSLPQGEPDDDNTREAQATYPLCRWWGGTFTTLKQDPMNHLYYDINPTPHAEKAYQPSDPAPPVSARPTYADAGGRITVLQTAIYNRSCNPGPCYGTSATFRVHSPAGSVVCEDTGTIPFRFDMPNVVAGRGYYIQPMTLNTMAKILPTNLAN